MSGRRAGGCRHPARAPAPAGPRGAPSGSHPSALSGRLRPAVSDSRAEARPSSWRGGASTGAITTGQGTRAVTFYLETDDVQAALDRAVAVGAEVVMPLGEVPGIVQLAQIRDPEGNWIGLMKNLCAGQAPWRAAPPAASSDRCRRAVG